jgi:hypothetical protein
MLLVDQHDLLRASLGPALHEIPESPTGDPARSFCRHVES